jgi:hypothetical protein
MICHRQAKHASSIMTAPQQPKGDSHTGEQYTNSMTNCQGTPQYTPLISPVGQDSSCYQHSVAAPYKPYMPQGQNYTDLDQAYTAQVQNYRARALYMDQAQNHLGQTQSYVSTGSDVPELPQGQTYICPSQNYTNTGSDPLEPLTVPPPEISSLSGEPRGSQVYTLSQSSDSGRSKTPVFGRSRSHNFQNRNQKGGGPGQRHHRSNATAGKQYCSLSQNCLSLYNPVDFQGEIQSYHNCLYP